MKRIPDPLNDSLIAISLAIGIYSVFKWHSGAGMVWKIVLGACLYFVATGLYQKFMTNNRTPRK